ncbi:hypothetical protein [Streptomyces sp. NPDC058751]|uniref:hypothetical protein n=1 Tax=Streptomyces sp. NPDC058751 TaxID=3346623 RepID=UPI0036BBE28A
MPLAGRGRALEDHGLKQVPLRAPAADSTAARERLRPVPDDHAVGEFTAHE